MRSRKWVISLVVIVLAVVFMVFYTWPYLQVNDQIQRLLERRLREQIGEGCSVDEVRVKWGVVWLLGVKLPVSKSTDIHIDSIRVAVNPMKYVTSGLRLRRLVSSLHLEQPRIQWQPFSSEGGSQSNEESQPLTAATVCQLADPWCDGFLVTWERGIVCVIGAKDTIEVVPEFRGIVRGERGKLSVNILGKCLAEADNLSITGKVNADSSTVSGQLHIDSGGLAKRFWIPGSIPIGLKPTDVTVSSSCFWDSAGIEISGDGTIELLEVAVDTYFVATVPQLGWEMTDTGLVLNDGCMDLPGLNIAYSGKIHSVLPPELDITLRIPDTEIGVVANLVPVATLGRLAGQLSGMVHLTGPPDSIGFSSSLQLPYVAWEGWRAQDFTVNCRGDPRLFKVEVAIGNLLESQVDIVSVVDLRGTFPTVHARVEAEGYFLRKWMADAPTLIVNGSGTYSKERCQWAGEIGRTGRERAHWSVAWQESTLSVTMSRSDRYFASLEMQAPILQAELQCDVDGFDALYYDVFGRYLLPPNWDVSGSLSGTMDQFNYGLDLYYDKRKWMLQCQGIYDKDTGAGSHTAGSLQLSGYGLLPRLNGEYRLEWLRDSLWVRSLVVEDFLTAHALIDLSSKNVNHFNISVNRMDLGEFAGQVPFLEKRGIAGKINAEIQGREVDDSLQWGGNVHWFDGKVAGLCGLWGTSTMKGSPSRIHIQEFQLGHEIRLLAYAVGDVNLTENTVSLTAFSQTNHVEQLISAVAGKRVTSIKGKADVDVTVTGSVSHPVVGATLGLFDGEIEDIPFPRIEVFASNLLQDYDQGNLTVDSLQAQVGPGFHITGGGTVPVKSAGQFDVSLSGSGDFAAIFGAMTDFFKVATSAGKLTLHLGGTVQEPRIDGGELGVRGGRMVMDGLFREAEDINLDLRFLPNGFVSLDRWEWQTRGTTMRWRNYPELRIETGFLEPIRIEPLGLNLGIWVLDYVSGPVRVNMPGLMESPWDGNFDLTGRVEGEKFLIAGPANHLLIRGEIAISNATLTYPFVSGSGHPSSFVKTVLRSLERARWDLKVDADPDVHYIREITSTEEMPIIGPISVLFNRITTDMTVDPESPGLTIQQPDTTLIIEGELESTRGSVEFLDMDFDVDKATLEFDRFDSRPWASARARTTVEDSLGFPRTIYLTLYAVDSLTEERTLRGRWGDFTLVLEDDQGQSQEEILAMLGYSVANIPGKVSDLGGTVVGEYVDEIVIKPVEQVIRKFTGVDRVDINPRFVQNVLRTDVLGSRESDTVNVNFGVKYLMGSRISVGQYLTNDLYVGYTGELAGQIEGIEGGRLGLIHLWNVEYRMKPLSPYLVLDLTYEYDNLVRRSDQGVLIRYSFSLP